MNRRQLFGSLAAFVVLPLVKRGAEAVGEALTPSEPLTVDIIPGSLQEGDAVTFCVDGGTLSMDEWNGNVFTITADNGYYVVQNGNNCTVLDDGSNPYLVGSSCNVAGCGCNRSA